jgi:hypothetical protein
MWYVMYQLIEGAVCLVDGVLIFRFFSPQFIDFAKDFTTQVRSQHFWADFIDPCSGLPMLTPNCNKVFSECDAHEVLLNYRTYNAGFCKILTHPSWGSSVYPATIFCYAPRNHILQLMQEKYPTVQEKP